jgi:hypothetical protein
MGRTLTNNFSLQYAIEQSLGVLPGSPEWKLLEPNTIGAFGSSISTVARSPISKNRQRRKGTITDLDSTVEFDADLTLEHFIDFIEGFMFANYVGPVKTIPTAVAAVDYTVPIMTAAIPQDTLVYARGFTNTANNGSKLVDTGGTTTSIPIVGSGLVVEAPPATQNVSVDISGFRFAAGDLDVDADGNLVSTVKDFTELNLTLGQFIWVGGELTINQFSNAENTGFARVVSIATNLLTLDKKGQTFVTEANTTQLVDLFFGQFIKNVGVDDGEYLERSFQFEGAYDNLDHPGPGDAYEYAKGNYCNTMNFELPLTSKAGVGFGFIGTDTEPPTISRASGADAPIEPVETGAFNTSADIARLRIINIDESGLTTDFKSLTLNINNNVSPEKVLAQLGAKYLNTGNFEIDIETQLLFTNPAVVTAIRNNSRLTMDFSLHNDDGAIMVDIPSLTLGGGGRDFPVNESILINVTAQAYGDTTFGNSLSVSMFPFVPSSS